MSHMQVRCVGLRAAWSEPCDPWGDIQFVMTLAKMPTRRKRQPDIPLALPNSTFGREQYSLSRCLTHDDVVARGTLTKGVDAGNGSIKVWSAFNEDGNSILCEFENVEKKAHSLETIVRVCATRPFGYLPIRFDEQLPFACLAENEILSRQSQRQFDYPRFSCIKVRAYA
jgi:hypothetical protein